MDSVVVVRQVERLLEAYQDHQLSQNLLTSQAKRMLREMCGLERDVSLSVFSSQPLQAS